jgi:predicted O-methyltransferase YrrM
MQSTDGTYHDMPQGMYPVHMFHPEFNTLGLWFPALDAWILEWLCRKLRGRLDIMEIGSFVGGSASILAPHAASLVCVDTWTGSGKEGDEMAELYAKNDVFGVFQKNLKLITDANLLIAQGIHIRSMPDSLPEYLSNLGRRFELIFIDGAHDYDSVAADIAVARQHIAPGGIICGHDFTLFDGVTKAALDFGGVQACGTIWWKEIGTSFTILDSKTMLPAVSKADAVEGWMTVEELTFLAEAAAKHRCILEFGSFQGRSTTALCESTPGVVHAVDAWRFQPGPQADILEEKILALGDNRAAIAQTCFKTLLPYILTGKCVLHTCLSDDFECNAPFDMIFIDADHRYENTKGDIQHAIQLAQGRPFLLCGHDYNRDFPGVIQAVTEMIPNPHVCGTIWWKEMK